MNNEKVSQVAPVEDEEIAEIERDLDPLGINRVDARVVRKLLNTLSDAKREIDRLREFKIAALAGAENMGAALSASVDHEEKLEQELQREKERADAGYEAYAATDEQLGKLQAQLLAVTNQRNRAQAFFEYLQRTCPASYEMWSRDYIKTQLRDTVAATEQVAGSEKEDSQ